MGVAWALGVWGTNSWVGMNAGPPNAWNGATTPIPVVTTTQTGGGYYKRQIPLRKHWLEEHRELKEALVARPVISQAKRIFKAKLPVFELPSVDLFLDLQEDTDRKRRLKQEEDELMELLQIL